MKHREGVTLADVARAAGVAKSTASYAFSNPSRLADATTGRVLAAAAALGYRGPSALGRALASGRSNVIAVVTKALLLGPGDDPFSLNLIDGLSRELADLGHGVLLLPPVVDARAAKLHATAIYDASVSVRRLTHLDETDAVLAARGVPWIKLDGGTDEHRAVTVQEDAASADLVRHLVGLGHRRVGVIALPFDRMRAEQTYAGAEVAALFADLPGEVPQLVPRARLRGFAGAGVMPEYVAMCDAVSYEAGHAAARNLLSLPPDRRPTALVCQADVYAWGAVDAAREIGLAVPGDVSVAGFDGLTGGVFDQLDLTTVIQDGVLKGRLVARWIVERVGMDEDPRPHPMPLTVRIGATTGTAPAGV